MHTVAIIDGEPLARAGLEQLVRRHARCQVVFSGATISDFDAAGVSASVVVMALGPELDAIARLGRHSAVLVTCAPPDPLLAGALQAGARGCVSRTADGQIIG